MLGLTVPPAADQEKHPHQAQVEKDIEEQQVQREEDAKRHGLQKEHPSVVLPRLVLRVNGIGNTGSEDQGTHRRDSQRDAVYA